MRLLLDRHRIVESPRPREQVEPAYDALEADPSRAGNAAQIRTRLAANRRALDPVPWFFCMARDRPKRSAASGMSGSGDWGLARAVLFDCNCRLVVNFDRCLDSQIAPLSGSRFRCFGRFLPAVERGFGGRSSLPCTNLLRAVMSARSGLLALLHGS